MWLAAENGMFLRHTKLDWIRTMEHLNMDWRESVLVTILTNLLPKTCSTLLVESELITSCP